MPSLCTRRLASADRVHIAKEQRNRRAYMALIQACSQVVVFSQVPSGHVKQTSVTPASSSATSTRSSGASRIPS